MVATNVLLSLFKCNINIRDTQGLKLYLQAIDDIDKELENVEV